MSTKWHNLSDISSYKIIKKNDGFVGVIVNKNNKIINIFGMSATVGFSYNKKTTERIVRNIFKELLSIVNK